jgi:hypothetical protein
VTPALQELDQEPDGLGVGLDGALGLVLRAEGAAEAGVEGPGVRLQAAAMLGSRTVKLSCEATVRDLEET